MQPLEAPDIHHFNAASGWFELGNMVEAKAELEEISSANQSHPDVFELRWRICAGEKDWPQALEAGRELVKADPENASGWIHQSYSLHELKRTREAFDLLLPVVGKFSDISTIPYNLACYACQLGDFETARQWLARAIKIRGKEDIKKMALADPDLQPVWDEIRKL